MAPQPLRSIIQAHLKYRVTRKQLFIKGCTAKSITIKTAGSKTIIQTTKTNDGISFKVPATLKTIIQINK